MEKPRIKGYTPESYEALKEYAEYLSTGIQLKGRKMEPEALAFLKWEARYAWREAAQMAVKVSQNFASYANDALEKILEVDKERE